VQGAASPQNSCVTIVTEPVHNVSCPDRVAITSGGIETMGDGESRNVTRFYENLKRFV